MGARIGWGELVIILIIALVVVGPEKLPKLGRTLGRAVKGVKNYIRETAEELDGTQEVREIGRDLEEIRRDVRSMGEDLEKSVSDDMRSVEDTLKTAERNINAAAQGNPNAAAEERDKEEVT